MEWFNKFISILKIPLKILLPSLWILIFSNICTGIKRIPKLNIHHSDCNYCDFS